MCYILRGGFLKNTDDKYNINDLVRKTFYIRVDQNKALKYYIVDEGCTEYDVVIKALDNTIPKKYMDMAQKEK